MVRSEIILPWYLWSHRIWRSIRDRIMCSPNPIWVAIEKQECEAREIENIKNLRVKENINNRIGLLFLKEIFFRDICQKRYKKHLIGRKSFRDSERICTENIWLERIGLIRIGIFRIFLNKDCFGKGCIVLERIGL